MALVNKGAALIVKDAEAEDKLLATALELAGDPKKIAEIENNVAPLARLDAAGTIAEEIYKLV